MADELTVRETDIIESEVVKINKFIEDGLPGLGSVTNTQLHRMLELYMTGSSYTQIATLLGIKKVIVQYLAHTSGWYDTKKEYLNELQENMKNKIAESKVKNQDFVLLATQAYRKKIGDKFKLFLATDDERHMGEVDLKEFTQLMKTIEMIDGLDNTGKDAKGKTPTVGINIGDGVTVEKSGDNKISITPNKEAPVGDMLRQYADEQREKERKKMLSLENKTGIVTNKESKNE